MLESAGIMQELDRSVRQDLQNLHAFFGEKQETCNDLCDPVRTLEEVVSTVTKAGASVQVRGLSTLPIQSRSAWIDKNFAVV